MAIDLQHILESCIPAATAAAAAWRVYLKKTAQAEAMRLKREEECEARATRDREECRKRNEDLEREIRNVRDEHMRRSDKAFDRLSDSIDELTKYRRRRDDETDKHHAQKG